jgi:hypothetical protein
MSNILNSILESNNIGFIEVQLVNQNTTKAINIELSSKKYFNIVNIIKKLTTNKSKKVISTVKVSNNYEERLIGNKIFYYNKMINNIKLCRIFNNNIIIKNIDNKILDPVEFPDLKKYHSVYKEIVYRYRYMPDNRVINCIDIFCSNIEEQNNNYFNIYFKFKLCDKNKKILEKNLLFLLKKINNGKSF